MKVLKFLGIQPNIILQVWMNSDLMISIHVKNI